jgi:hypothetical protein
MELARSPAASEYSSSVSGVDLPYHGIGGTPSDQSAPKRPNEELLAASSGIKLRFLTKRGTPDVHFDPTAAEHPESNTPSVGGVYYQYFSTRHCGTYSFRWKNIFLNTLACPVRASQLPFDLQSWHVLQLALLREESASVSSSDEQVSPVSPKEEHLGAVSSQFVFTAAGTPGLLSEGEMCPRRGPRVPATLRQPRHSPQGSSSKPNILPETRANREKCARERQSRERQTQEEARGRLAREEQSREQQAREARVPPSVHHVPDLPELAGPSNADAIPAVC